MDIPELGVFRWTPNARATSSGLRLDMETEYGAIVFNGTLAQDRFTGTVDFSGHSNRFRLRRVTARPRPYREEELRFRNKGVALAGSLFRPEGRGRHPAVLFIHGSGAEGRGGLNRFLADRLACRGIAAFAYDKRGVGESTGDRRQATFNDLVEDALAAIELLRTQAGIDGRRIGLFGSSDGAGYIAPSVVARSPDVAFLVLKSGPFVSPTRQYLFEDENALRAPSHRSGGRRPAPSPPAARRPSAPPRSRPRRSGSPRPPRGS
jgi:hypothetical protein